MQKYKIPFNYKKGTYHFAELLSVNKNNLVLSLEETGVLTYFISEYETETIIYDISEDMIKNHLLVTYDDNGKWEQIKIIQNDIEKLVFICLTDSEKIKNTILGFSCRNADIISNKILSYNEKIARLFMEYFYDGETADIAVKIGTVNNMQKILSSYSDEPYSIDNSEDYPLSSRIECENNTLCVILMCMPQNFRYDMFKLAVFTITNLIKERVLNLIDKSENFKFTFEEYD